MNMDNSVRILSAPMPCTADADMCWIPLGRPALVGYSPQSSVINKVAVIITRKNE